MVISSILQLIEPIADILQIPHSDVFAIKLHFDEKDGKYSGYDTNAPTSREFGKSKVVQHLLDARYSHLKSKSIIMIGDGNNDLQAKPPASLFIGYGGNVMRENIRQGADWYIHDFQVRYTS